MADLEFEEINRGNQPTQDGAGTDDAWTFTGKIIRNFNKIKAFFADSSNAASRKVGTSAGDVIEVGTGGFMFTNPGEFVDSPPDVSRFFRFTADNTMGIRFGVGISSSYSSNRGGAVLMDSLNSQSASSYFAVRYDSGWRIVEYLHTGNTATDSNGFIKAASPIIKLFNDKIEKTDHLETQSASFEKLGTGKYKLTGVPELSRDGWYIETPKDRNNNIYFTLDYEENNGELIIKTYEPDYSSGRAENGEPADILEGRFVSLRFAENPELYPEPEEEIGEE